MYRLERKYGVKKIEKKGEEERGVEKERKVKITTEAQREMKKRDYYR
jgi:hypothetical protein